MFKKIICIATLLIIMFSVTACYNVNLWQNQIDELEEKIDQLTDRVGDLEDENTALKQKIAELEEDLEYLKNIDYYNKEILSIYFYEIDNLGSIAHDFKLYDFEKMTYSEMAWEGPDDFEIKAVLSQEKTELFFSNIKGHGIFLLNDFYNDENVLDGGSWVLTIRFKDETTFKSSGCNKYPPQAEILNQDFFDLSGYNLF